MTTDDINAMLIECATEGYVEPIDDPNCHPLDWAEVVGIADDIFDMMYPQAMGA